MPSANPQEMQETWSEHQVRSEENNGGTEDHHDIGFYQGSGGWYVTDSGSDSGHMRQFR